ncbi:MAG: transglutaminase domain-containing protein, partial [Lysobacteraceae bacterium]
AKGTIRYRIAMRDGVAWPWPETGEQHVELDGNTVVLTVCTTCGQETPPTAVALQRDLQPNRWVDNNDHSIRMFARDVRGGTLDRSMRLLVRAVRLRINGPIDFGQYLTSREAYDARQGDCTETALLLAAAAKARHIPVRVVFGMAYASRFLGQKRVFGPHMWVQVWNGTRWTSYDAGLGEFDSTHIALAVGDGSPDEVSQVFAKLQDVRIVSAEGVLPALAVGH